MISSTRMESPTSTTSSSMGRIYGWLPHNTIYDRENTFAEYATPSQNTKLLRLKIFSGRNLAKKDIFGASDPYVRIDLLRSDRSVIDSVYTRTKKKTLNPSWNEEFIFRVIPSNHLLLIEVFDENRLTRDDFLGKVELSLSNLPDESEGNEIAPTRYILQQRSVKSKVRGDLEIYHAYIDESNTQNTFNEAPNPQSSEGNADSEWEIVTHLPSHVHSHDHEEASEFNEELPSGWEECQDTNGRTYFVNHNTRRTQWERPLNDSFTGGTTISEQGESTNLASQLSTPQQAAQHNLAQEFGRRFQIGSSYDQSSVLSNEHEPLHSTNSSGAASLTDPSYIPNNLSYSDACQLPLAYNQRTQSLNSGFDSTSLSNANNYSTTGISADFTSDDQDTVPDVAQANFGNTDNLVNSAQRLAIHEMAARRHSEPAATPGTPPVPAPPETNQQGQSAVQSRPHSHHHHHRHHNQDQTPNNQSLRVQQVTDQSSQQPHSQRPRAQTSTTPSRSSRSIPDDGLGPLPSGWSQQVAETGRIFFIDHNSRNTTWIDPRTGKPSPSQQSQHNSRSTTTRGPYGRSAAVDDLGPLPTGWEERVHRDGRIFFINHNTRTTQWDDPRIDNPIISGPPVLYSRDYKQKYEHLLSQLPRPTNVPNKFEIKVSRCNILEDSFRIISNVSRVDYLKTKLWIEFDNEEVLDYGGPSREWFYLLSKEMFNPYYGLFEYSSADKYTLQIKPNSGKCNEAHLAYFKFIGRVAGMAIYHGKLLDAFFIRPFYKMMLGKDIQLKDMESVDSEYFNSLKYILENDPSELYLNFSIDERFLDVVEERELKPNGASIPVTNDNKMEYINLVIDWRFVSRVKPQMSAFLEGFHELIPKKLIELFDENELELLMCGIGNVDVKDWKQNTVYKGGYVQNHIVIQWFWRVVLSFNNEMRSRLLQFVTGTSRVPMNGFKELYGSNGPQLFTIEKWGTTQNLPRSHTCFNRLDLPCYESYSDLREKLIKAIEGSETYGGVD